MFAMNAEGKTVDTFILFSYFVNKFKQSNTYKYTKRVPEIQKIHKCTIPTYVGHRQNTIITLYTCINPVLH